MRHYSEAELLELFYLPPADFLPMRVHMSECEECTLRYHGLQKKLQPPACETHRGKDATFWDRQRFSIMRKIQARESAAPTWQYPRRSIAAAAAVILLLVSGIVIFRPAAEPPATADSPSLVAAAAEEPTADPAAEIFQELRAVNDPWSSEELEPFRDVVEWESWAVEQAPAARGES